MLSAFLDEAVLPGVPLWLFWTFVAASVIIQGISKSGFAGGAGILALPLMMLVMRVDLVPATLLPLLILLDMNAIYHHWHNKVWPVILRIYLPSIGGILAGAAVWWYIGNEGVEAWERPLKAFVGIIAMLFGAYIFVKEVAMHWVERYKPGLEAAIPAGIAAGFTSTIAHAAGPIVSLYIYTQGLGKTLFVGSVAWAFTIINLTKLPFYVGVGLINPDVLLFDLCLVPFIPIGSWLGKWMHHRVSETWFNRVIFVLVVLAGIQLIFDVNVVRHGLELLFPG
jgi:hypothetical protein